MIDVEKKREFFVWLINHVSFQRREVIWILNYLVNHEEILANVHVVEQALETKRGLVFRDITQREEPMICSIEGHPFTNSDQIFHEIRLHAKQPLYIECVFPNSWKNEYYLSVLEDNPELSWNDTISEEIISEVEEFLDAQERESKASLLKKQIDAALEAGDKEEFFKLSDELNRLNLLIHES